MNRRLLERCLSTSLLASALSAGCNQAQVQPATQMPPRTTISYSNVPKTGSWSGPTDANLRITQPPATPIVPTVAVSSQTAPEATLTQVKLPVPDESGPQIVASPEPPPVAAKPVVSEFGHAPDYTWLTGKLQYSRFNKTWRLRYASVDQDDPYGGSVTIVDDLRSPGLKDGQHIHVEGRFVNPGAKGIAPPYEVTSIEIVEGKN